MTQSQYTEVVGVSPVKVMTDWYCGGGAVGGIEPDAGARSAADPTADGRAVEVGEDEVGEMCASASERRA